MSDSDDDPPVRKRRPARIASDSSGDDDGATPTKSLRLLNKKTFVTPSRNQVFASISDDAVSPRKIGALRSRKRQFQLVKERSSYNQRDGYSTDGSNEGEMDDFIDDGRENGPPRMTKVRRKKQKMRKRREARSARPKTRHSARRSLDWSSIGEPSGSGGSGENSSERGNDDEEGDSDDEESNDNPIPSPTKKKTDRLESGSFSVEDEKEAGEEETRKRGKRRGNVFESDESEELVEWSDEANFEATFEATFEGGFVDDRFGSTGDCESDSALSVTSLSSDASEDNVTSRAAKSSKSRRKKAKKTLGRNLERLRDVKRARQAAKKSRALEASNRATPIASPNPESNVQHSGSSALDESEVFIVEDPEDGKSERMERVIPVEGPLFDTSGDLQVISHVSANVCPISRKPLVDAVVNALCGHSYERAALKDLVQLSRMKGKSETRCPVAGCDQFVEDDWCY